MRFDQYKYNDYYGNKQCDERVYQLGFLDSHLIHFYLFFTLL